MRSSVCRGGRDSNQDRIGLVVSGQCALALVSDGMGGHADGERAAEITQQRLLERFRNTPQPLLDPLGFLHLALGAAHDEVVTLGLRLPLEQRPRATCVACVVQDASAYWAHAGDSRLYHIRAGRVLDRTRDHSHVELLLREGVIGPGQVQNHPMRNFVESCLGGEPLLPEMSISGRNALLPGDVLLLCTDGLWSMIDDERLGGAFAATERPLADLAAELCEMAVLTAGPAADNTSVIVLRFLG